MRKNETDDFVIEKISGCEGKKYSLFQDTTKKKVLAFHPFINF